MPHKFGKCKQQWFKQDSFIYLSCKRWEAGCPGLLSGGGPGTSMTYLCSTVLVHGLCLPGLLTHWARCWSTSHHIYIPARRPENQSTPLSLLSFTLCVYLIGQNLVTWPLLVSREAGKCSPVAGCIATLTKSRVLLLRLKGGLQMLDGNYKSLLWGRGVWKQTCFTRFISKSIFMPGRRHCT